MNKILEKRQLSEVVYYMKFEAPDIARNRKAGQFLIVQVDQDLTERIPLTIADANAEEGWVAIAFQPVGASTYKLSQLKEGDYLGGVLGPLGTPSQIRKYDAPVVCVGGGFGTAPPLPDSPGPHGGRKQGHPHRGREEQGPADLRGRDEGRLRRGHHHDGRRFRR